MKNAIYSFRYLLKARGSNITRTISLALGLIVGITIFSYVNYQLTYNRNFPDKERIYQMFTWYNATGLEGASDYLTAPVAPAMAEEIPQIESATRFLNNSPECIRNEYVFKLKGVAADTCFFDVLDYGVILGNPKEILRAPGKVMLSQSAAGKIFEGEDPIGKILEISGKEVVVSGIFSDPPLNNNLGELEIITPLAEFNPGTYFDSQDSYPTYIKIKPETRITDVEAQLPGFWERHEYTKEMEQYKQSFYFVPLTRSNLVWISDIIYMLSAIALLTLFISCMNYILISLSALVERNKTIAMLKCSGAEKADIFRMFLWETLLITLFASLVAALIIISFKAQFENVLGYKLKDIFAFERIYTPFLVIAGTCILAGLIPAKLFSSVPLSAAFRGSFNSRRIWKKGLLFLQITCVTFVIILLQVINLQYHRLKSGDPGYKYEKLLHCSLSVDNKSYQTLFQELRSLSQVESAALSWSIPVYGYSGTPLQDIETDQLLFSCRFDYIDAAYLPLMEIPLTEGENFRADSPETDIIVNENFVKNLGGSGSPVGKNVKFSSSQIFTIRGVVKDFQMEASHGIIQPLVFYNQNHWFGKDTTAKYAILHIKLKEMGDAGIEAVTHTIGRLIQPGKTEVTSFKESRNRALRYERSYKNIILTVSLFTFFILLLGLTGYISDEIRRRRKEIAIRKVNGAALKDICSLFFKDFSRILFPAVITGLASGYYISVVWLRQYAIKISLSAWIFMAGGFFVIAVVYLVILYFVKKTGKRRVMYFLTNS